MDEHKDPWTIQPGHGLGQMSLGATLQSVLSLIKGDTETFPAIELIYSPSEPLSDPVIVQLPTNGLRLRFDGPEQRLRLIEILDFGKCQLAYKGSELVKQKENAYTTTGPTFRRVYQIFGAAFPGEYLEPKQGRQAGTYVLSWPGVAISFPLQHTAWSPSKDHVSLLGSHAASPASHMAIFEGANWSQSKADMFTRTCSKPRSLHIATRPRDSHPVEVESAVVTANGDVELMRKAPALSFHIKLNETTPEDLVTELGPPDAKHRRDTRAYVSEERPRKHSNSMNRPLSNGRYSSSQPSSYSSTGTDTYDTDFDNNDTEVDSLERASRETFWCYFNHGFDVLVGPPSPVGGGSNATLHLSPYPVVTKIVLHGNVPGSYAFNRHRRLRWSIKLDDTAQTLSSECNFEAILKPTLLKMFTGVQPASEMARGKVVNRTWSGSPTDSSFFLPDAEEDLIEGSSSEQWLGNTRLYHFPRLAFEVMENGAVSALTIT